jgi:hypothetical protein
MIALREGAKELNHEHFHGGIMEVAAKKKSDHFVRILPPIDWQCLNAYFPRFCSTLLNLWSLRVWLLRQAKFGLVSVVVYVN